MSDDKVISLGAKKSRKKAEELEKIKKLETQEQNQDEVVYCSFCGRPNTQVIKMVQGPGVNICSECTMIAVQYLILNDRMLSADAQMILDAFWGKCNK
ncbi:ClpX C4-type zinc finger protein [bacterium]|nr:ClpX C4-type zinc finger protein [bacterium]